MLDSLERAIRDRNASEIDRWGVHVRTMRDELVNKLEKQYDWLGPENAGHPRYEERFSDWTRNLAQYTRACRLLTEAYQCL